MLVMPSLASAAANLSPTPFSRRTSLASTGSVAASAGRSIATSAPGSGALRVEALQPVDLGCQRAQPLVERVTLQPQRVALGGQRAALLRKQVDLARQLDGTALGPRPRDEAEP